MNDIKNILLALASLQYETTWKFIEEETPYGRL